MTFKMKVKNFYEKNKFYIGVVTGVVVMTGATILLAKVNQRRSSGDMLWRLKPENEFPLEMPIPEIKAALITAGTVDDFKDALIVRRGTLDTMFIRDAVDIAPKA